jgi:hypothetical protein
MTMGLFDKLGIDPSKLASKIMGANVEDSRDAKRKIREIFDSQVEDGAGYTLVAAFFVFFENKLLKQIQTYYNYIIGYRDGDDPDIVVLPVSWDLASIQTPVLCKLSQCGETEYDAEHGMFRIEHPALEKGEVKFGVIPSTSLYGGYIIKVSYVDEMMPFADFFQKRFCK